MVSSKGPQHPFVNKVLNLGDNFTVCYYAGAAKNCAIAPPQPPSAESTPWQRRRLEQRRDALLPEWQPRSEKVKRMRADLEIEVGTAIKFQLEQQLLSEEAHLAQLEQDIQQIETELEQ